MKFVIKKRITSIFPKMLLVMLLLNSLHAQPVELRFQPEINAKAIRLGEILIIKGITQPTWSNLPLDSHPTPGEILTKTTILNWMTQKLGAFDLIWKGKTQMQVKQSSLSSGSQLIEIAKNALIKELDAHYLHVKVIPLSHLKDNDYVLDEVKTSIHVPYPAPKRVCVWLSHGDKKRIAVWFKIEAYANVLVAHHRIHSNTLLEKKLFSIKERNIAGLNSPPVISIPKSVWLQSSMERNAILLKNKLKTPPLILQGQHVNLAIHHHGITIRMDTIALKEGYAGDTIPVKDSIHQTIFTVKIRDAQQVEL